MEEIIKSVIKRVWGREKSLNIQAPLRQGRFQTGLLGLHQIENAGMALTLLDAYCRETGRELASNNIVAQALEETSWPGRFEVCF